ncbi:LPS-assembly protein LptD [Deltaproteobacteria bacterium]|nr:LPS-assembly protein LptD [Deltaproteobacteria bacterium]
MIRVSSWLVFGRAGFAFLLFLVVSLAPCVQDARGAQGTPEQEENLTNLTMRAEDERNISWSLTADKVTTLSSNDVIEATGHVVLQRGSESLKADYARYYAGTKWVFLRGNVDVHMGRDAMQAEEAEFDLRSRVGWLKRGRIFMAGPHMYLAGERIDKHWGDVYSFVDAKLTVCDGDVPAWSLEADEAVVEIDGYAQLWRPRLQIKDIPVMMSPWMIIPAKKERQTGFLTPEYGQSSKRGFYYNQPFFWAIDESRDITLNEYFMDRHGLMQGVQYRSRPSIRETTWLRIDWLYDKKRVTDDSNDPVNPSDGYVRTNQNRYWLRGMYEGQLADPKWKLRMDVDFLSDQNFLHEFSRGDSGYDRSREDLFRLFNRDIQEKDLLRQSGLMLFRDWERVSVNFSSTYLQDPTLGHGNRKLNMDDTVQHLPQIDIFLNKGYLIDPLPFEIAANAEAGYMYRRNGTRGMRYSLSPTLSLPLNSRYGSLIASAGLQQTFYATDSYEKTAPNGYGAGQTAPASHGDHGKHQTVPTFQIDASSNLTRTYSFGSSLTPTRENVGETTWTAAQHTIQPRVRYKNIPLENQNRNPFYDSNDRIRPQNELTYSLTNIITRKRERVIAKKPAKENEEISPEIARDYLDFLRLSLEQTYDVRESRREDKQEEYARRPYGDLIAEATVNFSEYLAFTSRSAYSPYLDTFTSHDHGVTLNYVPWGHLYTGFGYRRAMNEYLRTRNSDLRMLTASGELTILDPFSLQFSLSQDLENGDNVNRELRLVYQHQCFQIMGVFAKDAIEEHYGFRIALVGF